MPYKDPRDRRAYNKKYYQLHPELKKNQRLYRRRPEVREHMKCPEVKADKLQHQRKYRQSSAGKELRRRYQQSPKGKLTRARHHARHRAKGFKLLCPNIWGSLPVDFHHIAPNSSCVVPLPRTVHQTVAGSSGFHFAFNAAMVSQLYRLNFGEDLKCPE